MTRRLLLAVAVQIVLLTGVFGQTAPATYRIAFTDKTNTPYTIDHPEAYLGQRSIERRQQQGIPIDPFDLPVDPAYVDALLASGQFELMYCSKWTNSVTIHSTDTLALDTIDQLPFVASVRLLADGRPHSDRRGDKFRTPVSKGGISGPYEPLYGESFRQIEMLNGHLLHAAGAMGQGMRIGVLDSGFDHADSLPAFADLFARNGVVMTEDVVDEDGDVYHDHWHGRTVLSCLAGHVDGHLLGSAPEADYVLVRTENAASEYIVEEDNWVRGAELCDSLGCDVLNTSLGYTTFDDSLQDHDYADMDGMTTRISIAASIAASRGMVVVVSAGNSGAGAWHYIGAPADAAGVLAVGAVGPDRVTASFSSRGPSSDGRVKPDVAAVGFQAYGLGIDGSRVDPINGTSFSSPVLAGGVTCLWQLHPDRTAAEVRDAVIRSASRYSAPDSATGYGIPDLWRAHLLLNGRDLTGLSSTQFMEIAPVPFTDHFELVLFTGGADRLDVRLYGPEGRMTWEASKPLDPGTYQRLWLGDPALAALSAGVYVLDAVIGSAHLRRSLVKAEQ
ncbi:MAG: S8 family serine peptidase [Flavobacteriales bacterium]|nr:S8 family serine peptidase [Flavobacteriales bacterium]